MNSVNSRIIFFACLVFQLASCSSETDNPGKLFKQLNVIPIEAHRGGGFPLPENTLETFEYTWNQRLIPEADIRTTKDDVIICMHDDTPRRLAPDAPVDLIDKDFSEMNLATVKTLDVGIFRGKLGERVPTLEEVFQVMQGKPERFLALDYKDIDLDRLADMVKKYHLEKQIIFTSQYYHLIREWKKRIPESLTMMWMGTKQIDIEEKISMLHTAEFKNISIIQVYFVANKEAQNGKILSNAEFLAGKRKQVEVHDILFMVFSWKDDRPEVYHELKDLGIRAFASDYPDMARKVYLEHDNQ